GTSAGRAAHRHVSLDRRGRPEREQDGDRRSYHPPAVGHRRLVSERTLPAPEPGDRDEDPPRAPARAEGAGAGRGASEGARRAPFGRLGKPDPLVCAPPLHAREGPPYRRRGWSTYERIWLPQSAERSS